MRIQDFNPVIKEDNEMADVVTAHGLVGKALDNPASRQEYFDYMTHLRNKHGKEYSTRIHQKATALAKSHTVDETIVKVGSQYELKSHTGKNLGKYPTKAGAKKREQQVNYFKHVNEAGGNYEELKNRRLRNEDPFVVYDHTLNGVILTSDSLEEATKEAVEWAAYDDITVSVIKKANKRKVLTIDGYSGAMDYYEEHGFPEELDEDAWTGDNPAWHNGNDQWHDGTDQWHSADDGAGGGAKGGGLGSVTGATPVEKTPVDTKIKSLNAKDLDDKELDSTELDAKELDTEELDESFNPQDIVSVDVPLLIRLFEYAREDAETDADLHNLAERLIALSQEGNTLTMQDYDTICNTKETD
jgi:hypothetical protein